METWGYTLQGHAQTGTPYSCRPQFEVTGAGQSGGMGYADLALGHFGEGGNGVAQVLGEFKDIRSGLDARQCRKQNDRSPVDQCFDYLQSAWQNRDRDALVEPTFALVTDMNEFRLYIRRYSTACCATRSPARRASRRPSMGHALRYPPELLRDLLIEESQSSFYNPEGSRPWDAMRGLFRAMRDGGPFGPHAIDRFNGGLFAEDPELEALHIPAKVFCTPGQATAILAHPRTLLYFSGAYNFGLTADVGNRAISLYTLGRIFDEVITYTALQFFRGTPSGAITCAFAPDGNASAIDWPTADRIPYDELPEDEAWTLAPVAERRLIERLNKSCKTNSCIRLSPVLTLGVIKNQRILLAFSSHTNSANAARN